MIKEDVGVLEEPGGQHEGERNSQPAAAGSEIEEQGKYNQDTRGAASGRTKQVTKQSQMSGGLHGRRNWLFARYLQRWARVASQVCGVARLFRKDRKFRTNEGQFLVTLRGVDREDWVERLLYTV